MTTKDLVKTNYPSIRRMFESEDLQDQLSRAIPSMMDVDQLIRISLTVIRTNPKLLDCSQQSLMACVFGCAQLGLSPEPFLGQAYFVPFWNSKLRSNEATFIPGYRGMISLWRRSGEGHNLSAKVVYEKDDFAYDLIQWELGNRHAFKHIPCEDEDRGRKRGAWAILHYLNGTPSFDYMIRTDILKRKEATKARNQKGEIVGPWIDWEDEMWKKTVIKYVLKTAPLSVEDNRIIKAAHAEDLALSGESQRDFFLPHHDEPIEIGSNGGISGKDAAQEFDDNHEIPSDNPQFIEFLTITAKSNGITVNEVKEQALGDLGGFMGVFRLWLQKQKPKQQPKKKDREIDDQELYFINDWIRLRNLGFKPYVLENLDLFRTCSAETLHRAQKKWQTLYPDEDWPVKPPSEVVYQPPEEVQKTEGDSKGEEEKVDPGGNERPMEAEMWSMLDNLKEKHPSIYLRVTKGHRPQTVDETLNVINEIKGIVMHEVGGGIPGA